MADIEADKRGVIKIYFPLKEYGFITREKGRDLFFLRSAFESEDQIVSGAIVEFSVEKDEGGRGERAISIRRVS